LNKRKHEDKVHDFERRSAQVTSAVREAVERKKGFNKKK